MTCRHEGCTRKVVARRMCHTHWRQWRRTFDAAPPRPTVAERLWSKIVRDPVTGCWLWTGAAMPTGHGISGNTTAYRVMYELIVEPIPDGLELDHLCRVPACVNPAHLEPVTHAENQRRMKYLHRGSHCRRGHPLAPPNIIAAKDGGHRCKTCRNINARAKRAARRTA